MHTTNYRSTFIRIADDCPVQQAEVPPSQPASPSVAALQFQMLWDHPYAYTSDEVLFGVWAQRQGIPAAELEAARAQFFSKGQPCFRSSPLTKRYGWGVHSDAEGRVAIYAAESEAYRRLAEDPALAQVKAMRSKRA
ncbi:MAG: DUF6157 family protein [Bacteroidia bacterium]|nr:DUF6157 family protein [Bacteroidia bacterium]